MTTRILIADDHEMFRSGLKALLERERDFEVVGEAANGHEAIAKVTDLQPDVLVLDLSMPGGVPGARVAEAALAARSGLLIVVVTMHEDEYYFREMLRIGVRGFVLKKSSPEDLVQAVRTMCQGGVAVDRALTHHMVATFIGVPDRRGKRETRLSLLTPRERQVCQALALGHTNGEVGKKLFISERTVETHRTNIMCKLELRSRADLVRFAIDHGLLAGPPSLDNSP